MWWLMFILWYGDNNNYRDCGLGWLLLITLETLKENSISLEQTIANLRHSVNAGEGHDGFIYAES